MVKRLRVSSEEDYVSEGGEKQLGTLQVDTVDVATESDEYYEFLRSSGQKQKRFIAEKLLQIERRLDALEKE